MTNPLVETLKTIKLNKINIYKYTEINLRNIKVKTEEYFKKTKKLTLILKNWML